MVISIVLLTLAQEYFYETKEDTMPQSWKKKKKITLQTFTISIKMKASINFIESESSDFEDIYSGQIILLKRVPG